MIERGERGVILFFTFSLLKLPDIICYEKVIMDDHLITVMSLKLTNKTHQLISIISHKLLSKLRKEYGKAVYCHPACLTYMQITSFKMLGWMNHKLESRLLGEYQQLQICR